ncbi:MAG: alpha-ketoacid dehydrogenase subunit beta [Chloroflexota bacterium]|nr:alpha-ketoacid dehydrogenase subunit beta [Chloroflexota bacterium]
MKELTFTEAVRRALQEEMRNDESVYLLGEDLRFFGAGMGNIRGLWEEFGDGRVIDSPISEAAILGTSVGAAAMGLRPVAEISFCDLFTVCFDQIYNQAAKLHYMSGGNQSVPLTILTSAGGPIGGAAQHSQSLEALCVHCPGLKVVYPSMPHDAYGLLKSSIRDNNPVVFFGHKLLYMVPDIKGPVPDEEFLIPLGQADVKKPGKDVTVITYGFMVYKALAAAGKLSQEGIDVEIVDPRTLSPLDIETLVTSVKKTRRAVVVHEAPKTGGFGGELAAVLAEEAFDYLDAPILRVAAPDTPIPFSPPMEQFYFPNEESIVEGVKKVLTA